MPLAQSSGITVLLGDPRLPDAVKRGGRFNDEDLDTVSRLKSALDEIDCFRFRYHDDHTALMEIVNEPPEFVLNFCDEGLRNRADRELHVAALLETFDIPYSGAGPECLALCRNKGWVRAVAAALGIAVPWEVCVAPHDVFPEPPVHAGSFAFPVLVKPNSGDGSLGITRSSLVGSPDEITACLRQVSAAAPDSAVLIQEFLPGAEYSVALVGNPGDRLEALPVLEVDYSRLDPALPPLLTWESKWDPESPDWQQIGYRPAEISACVRDELVDWSRRLFGRLECRDYARFDYRTGRDGVIKLLEVNPNPGWSWDGKLNLMAGFGGMSYRELLRGIIDAGQRRRR